MWINSGTREEMAIKKTLAIQTVQSHLLCLFVGIAMMTIIQDPNDSRARLALGG